jgi:hypothetical protein
LFLHTDGKCLKACPEFFEEDSAAKGKCKAAANKCAAAKENLEAST